MLTECLWSALVSLSTRAGGVGLCLIFFPPFHFLLYSSTIAFAMHSDFFFHLQAWEYSVKMLISVAVKPTFHGGENLSGRGGGVGGIRGTGKKKHQF